MKIVMIEKGYKYGTEDGSITITKNWTKCRMHVNEHSTLDSYRTVSYWFVKDAENKGFAFKTLAQAKKFINENYIKKGE